MFEEDFENCRNLQREEWEVLESIYPDFVSRDPTNEIVKLDIPVDLGCSMPAEIVNDGTIPLISEDSATPDVHKQSISLKTLPPVLLSLVLPPDYPVYAPPRILWIRATSSWLPRIHLLQEKLLQKWNAPEGVLYEWVEWIRSSDFLRSLDLIDESGVIRLSTPAPQLLAPLLLHHDSVLQATRFSQNAYECQVCLTSVKGSKCIVLSCGHIFCRSCLEDFWRLCVEEGDVSRVTCPDPACVKAARAANEEEVRRVLMDKEVTRWKWLRQKQELEKDPTIIHCPVAVCQTPVPGPKGADAMDGTGWERLRTCQTCNYSFCAYCRRTWHGPISECALSVTDSFLSDYMNASEGSRKRLEIEQRYGRANVLKLVARFKEDQANRAWLEASTMACPTCRVHVEKSHGCNHMTCGKCKTHFCYRCGEKLLASNPYVHFSTPGRRCFSKLFDFNSEENEWEPVDLFEIVDEL
ncbi:hypothetical protein PUNSTDRAFT_79212 [Punctularia strigosozonata HHB-11173 SS5]|uniref:uncharacterized protein n=1 Tax=Punctularia strigosozonata (strain HHB-11173) TaxID=741275 RepID=UPI0004417B0F|nr:uncharacterized protein PUNSTDRAFT_79212 [Punctularia strigosozonata HHB-11173 SS5]EIN13576.1 hypothetical protein PUNSTDRAFT_79212 [Punctularia strigosozonata HHB-11173 SS5]